MSTNDVGAAVAALLTVPATIAALTHRVNELTESIADVRDALPRSYLSVDEAAKRFGVSTATLRRAIKRGDVSVVRIGRALRVDIAQVPRIDRALVDQRAKKARGR